MLMQNGCMRARANIVDFGSAALENVARLRPIGTGIP